MDSKTFNQEVDFKYFINLALMNKLPWDSLVFVLKDLATTLEKSNEVIEVLVQELQKLQIELQNFGNQSDNSTKQIEIDGLIDEQRIGKTVNVKSENDCHSEFTQYKQENYIEIDGEISTIVQDLEDFESDKNDLESNSGSKEKSLQCITCSKSFKQKSHLDRHKKIHSDERSFSCGSCEKKFRSSNHLKTHELIHKDEKPFSCHFCGKKFKQIYYLKSHAQ